MSCYTHVEVLCFIFVQPGSRSGHAFKGTDKERTAAETAVFGDRLYTVTGID